jgi:MFS family permease
MMFQFNVVFGILISYLSNYLIGLWIGGDTSWRVMLGIQAVPSLLFLILLRFVPETPRWLILKRNNTDEARSILKIINPDTYQSDLQDILDNNREEHTLAAADVLFAKKNKLPVFLAICFAVFNQVSGINAIIYYAPRIFEMAGLGRQSSLLSTAGIGFVNFLFTMLAINFIDKIGRRTLMLIRLSRIDHNIRPCFKNILHRRLQWFWNYNLPDDLYSIFCLFARCSYMGIYFRNFSKQCESKRTNAGKLYTLDDGGAYHFFISHTGREIRGRKHFSFLQYHDGFTVIVCAENNA